MNSCPCVINHDISLCEVPFKCKYAFHPHPLDSLASTLWLKKVSKPLTPFVRPERRITPPPLSINIHSRQSAPWSIKDVGN